ncbi:MAG: ABC transporter substrate-binding protein [bacterium]
MANPSPNRLTPREEIKLKLEQEEKIKYDPDSDRYNAIFWGTPQAENIPFIQKLRTFAWFVPDILFRIIDKTKPISFILLYFAISFLSWKALVYASSNPESILNPPTEQVLIEGAVGRASSFNPLFITNNQIVRDVQQLIFNKLVRISKDETIEVELAESWAISSDGKTYTLFLRKDVKWQDGEQFTSDDVTFTLNTMKNLSKEESYAEAFEDVEFKKIDDYTVLCVLPEASATFLESLSIYIVPEHILGSNNASDIRFSNFNNFPVGTGPFELVLYGDNEITLKRNNNYFRDKPRLEKIIYKLFSTEEEAVLVLRQFEVHTLSQITYSTTQQLSQYTVYNILQFPLNLRQKLIYINLRNTDSPLLSKEVRQALSRATNRGEIITAVLGEGEEALGPIPSSSWAFDDKVERYSYDQEKANMILESQGWKYEDEDSLYRSKDGEELTVTLTLLDSQINNSIAQILEQQWQAVGVKLIPNAQTFGRISGEIIPRREFEMLLFEIENIPDPDKYNLWHSLKAEYPGLNLSGYSYDRVDIILEQSRTETDQAQRKENYSVFQRYIMEDMPALYLYHPTFTFVVHDSVKGVELEDVSLPQDRYNNVTNWYIEP